MYTRTYVYIHTYTHTYTHTPGYLVAGEREVEVRGEA